jgi:hypothetical protein
LLLGILLALPITINGCASFGRNTYILTETEQYYFIPPNTAFNAQLVKDGPVVEVKRTQPTWAVDAGYLAKLQEEANAKTLGK